MGLKFRRMGYPEISFIMDLENRYPMFILIKRTGVFKAAVCLRLERCVATLTFTKNEIFT
jgi:hypothetical protein